MAAAIAALCTEYADCQNGRNGCESVLNSKGIYIYIYDVEKEARGFALHSYLSLDIHKTFSASFFPGVYSFSFL